VFWVKIIDELEKLRQKLDLLNVEEQKY